MPTVTVMLRPAVRADLPVLGRLGALLVRMHHDFDPARFIPAAARTDEAYAAFLGAQLEKPSAVLLVAERDTVVIGYAFGAVEGYDYRVLRGPTGVLPDLIVDPAHRGSGIGRMLLDAAIAALAAQGAPRVVLATAARNAAAQRMFARAGFRRTMIEMTREL